MKKKIPKAEVAQPKQEAKNLISTCAQNQQTMSNKDSNYVANIQKPKLPEEKDATEMRALEKSGENE